MRCDHQQGAAFYCDNGFLRRKFVAGSDRERRTHGIIGQWIFQPLKRYAGADTVPREYRQVKMLPFWDTQSAITDNPCRIAVGKDLPLRPAVAEKRQRLQIRNRVIEPPAKTTQD